MAKILPRRKAYEHFKLNLRRRTYKLSILANILMGLYIYDPETSLKIINHIKSLYPIILNYF